MTKGKDIKERTLLRVGPAAAMLGVHENTLRRWADAGYVK